MLDDLTRTFTVGELSNRIVDALDAAFSNDVWVQGTIVNLNRGRNGHVYFELCELSDEPGQPPIASISVALFKMNKDVVNSMLRRVGNVRMEDGIRARIRGVVTFYPRTGRLQLRMTSIDPSFTLGSMAADRERVLRRLFDEGVLELNKTASLAPAPTCIGLITAARSAAYHDFVTELANSGVSWHVCHVDVQVQGIRAESAICAAFAALAAQPVEVIALVRGGGSRTDLMAFDSELVARTIAQSPVPVFTGIGHETDRAIADEAAHSAYKTPTACAQALVSMVRDYVLRCEEVWATARRLSQQRLEHHDARVTASARRAATATSRLLLVHQRATHYVARRVASETRHAIAGAQARLDHHWAAVGAASARPLRQAAVRVDQCQGALAVRPGRSLVRAERRLDSLAARGRAHDPLRVLARGFTITRGADGSVVRSAAALGPDAELTTTFADGRARSVVVSVDPAPPAPAGLDPSPLKGPTDR